MKHKITIDWTKVDAQQTFNLKELTKWAIEQILKQDSHATVENIAEQLGISLRTCFRMLKSESINVTEKTRIRKARELLKECGYEATKRQWN